MLKRKYIPLEIRCVVAWRQCAGAEIDVGEVVNKPLRRRLNHLLILLFKGQPHDLHHRPALVNRQYDSVRGVFIPDELDPDHLIYLEKREHLIETHVHGVGALRSDTGTRNHQKAMERNRGLRPRKRSRPIKSRGFGKQHRPFQTWRGFQ